MKLIASLKYLIKLFKQKAKDVGCFQTLRLSAVYAADNIISFFFTIAGYLAFLVRPRSHSSLHQRIEILRRFFMIHRSIHCAHQEIELLFIADEILSIPAVVDGDIIECGVYKGGSTCKLSIVAKVAGRQVIACDSFQGLPEPRDFDAIHICRNGKKYVFEEGDWLGTVEEVRSNLKCYGEPNLVSIVPGWFYETLPNLRHRKFACIFIDVDLYDSIICCLQNLWPGLQVGCKLFMHEADCELTIKALTDCNFWETNFGIIPPKFNGAERGLRPSMRQLGYIEKSSFKE